METHATLETNCIICQWLGDKLIVYATSQAPARLQLRLARALGIPQNKVRVVSPRVGGGFGGKTGAVARPSIILAALARKTGLPVKMRLTMAEKIACTTTRYPAVAYLKAGARKDGSLTVLQGKLISSEGAHAEVHGITEGVFCSRFDTYRLPNYDFHAQSVYTNRVPGGPMRPYTGCEGFWLSETFFDELAEELGEDPAEFRAKNIVRAGDQVHVYASYPRGVGLLPGGDPPLMIRMAAEKFRWKDRWKGWRKTAEVNGPKVRSVGVAVGHHIAGGVLSDTVIIKVNPDGSVVVGAAACEMGQGFSTAVSQVVAEALGVSPERVAVVTDTEVSGWGYGSVTQRGTPCTIGAARLAAEDARQKLLWQAAEVLT